jgi:hypothetical protein
LKLLLPLPAQPCPWLVKSDLQKSLLLRAKVQLGSEAASKYTDAQLQRNYGLKSDDMPDHLTEDIDLYVKTARDPAINVMRVGVYDGPQAEATMDRAHKDFSKFFGFLKTCKGWQLEDMFLATYCNVDLVTDFLEFLSARKVSPTELVTQVTLARRVNVFLANLLGSVKDGDNCFKAADTRLQALLSELRARRRQRKGALVK